MIALVEGAERQKTPNEIALKIMIAGLTIIFLFAVATLVPYAIYSVNSATAMVGAVPAPDVSKYFAIIPAMFMVTYPPHGEHVVLHHPVHAGDANRGQQSADCRGNEAHQQRQAHQGLQ
jgi:high-affinity K+ transport system ATPase subunit B